jgi:hypothetical protein
MLPLPVPERGGSIEALQSFLNLSNQNDFVLVVAWLLAALRSSGPYPLLAISGEQGSTKTVLSKLLRALVDPNVAPVRALPREERELMIAANNGHLLAFDNLSGLPLGCARRGILSQGSSVLGGRHAHGPPKRPGEARLREKLAIEGDLVAGGRRPRHRKTFALFLLATLRHTGPVHIKLLATPCLLHIFLLHCAAFLKGFHPRVIHERSGVGQLDQLRRAKQDGEGESGN